MLDMGFIEDIHTSPTRPAARQTVMYSATFGGHVGRFAATELRDPERVDVASHTEVHADIEQRLHWADNRDHKNAARPHPVRARCRPGAGLHQHPARADALADRLAEMGRQGRRTHGGMPQGRRNRVLEGMRGAMKVLVATDVAGAARAWIHQPRGELRPADEERTTCTASPHRLRRSPPAGAVTLAERRDAGMIQRIQRFTTQRILATTDRRVGAALVLQQLLRQGPAAGPCRRWPPERARRIRAPDRVRLNVFDGQQFDRTPAWRSAGSRRRATRAVAQLGRDGSTRCADPSCPARLRPSPRMTWAAQAEAEGLAAVLLLSNLRPRWLRSAGEAASRCSARARSGRRWPRPPVTVFVLQAGRWWSWRLLVLEARMMPAQAAVACASQAAGAAAQARQAQHRGRGLPAPAAVRPGPAPRRRNLSLLPVGRQHQRRVQVARRGRPGRVAARSGGACCRPGPRRARRR